MVAQQHLWIEVGSICYGRCKGILLECVYINVFFSSSVTQVSVVQSSSSSIHPSAHSSQSSNKLPIRSGHTHHSGDAQNLRAAQVRRTHANLSTHNHILISFYRTLC